MLIAGMVLAALAAALHVFIFYLESVAWTGPRARAVFRTSPQDAEATKFMAFNQGFYNLFLAIVTVVGIAAYTADHAVGITLALAGTGSMLAAALVLLVASAPHRPAAVRQGFLPLLAVIALVVAAVAR